MLRSSKLTLMRIESIVDAWASGAPGESFFGRTLEQFKAEVQPIYALRAEAAELDRRWTLLMAKRKDADIVAVKLGQNVVRSVRADPKHGDNSPLYAAMGFVRQIDRSSGLRRGGVKAPPKEGDTVS